MQVLLLVESLRSSLLAAGRATARRGAQVLLAKEVLSGHDFVLDLVSICCEEILIRFVQFLLGFDCSTLGCGRHSNCSKTVVVHVGSVIEAMFDLLKELGIVKALLVEVCQIGLQLVRLHQLRRLSHCFLALRVPRMTLLSGHDRHGRAIVVLRLQVLI